MSDTHLGETLVLDLPAPVGRLTLLGSNGAFATFKRLTRARGVGPLAPNGQAAGVDLRKVSQDEWSYLDYETFPLLVHALAETHHPRLAIRQLEDTCTPKVIETIAEPVTRYLLRVLRPILVAAEENGNAPPDPTGAPRTPTSSSGRSGPTP